MFKITVDMFELIYAIIIFVPFFIFLVLYGIDKLIKKIRR